MAQPPNAPIYYALIGDIVGSKGLPDRADVQRTLKGLVESLGEALEGAGRGDPPAPVLAAPLKLTAGDELQALLTAPEFAVDLVVRLADELHPTTIAWGLGAGRVATEIGRDVALIDGPCFHHAREAVEAASEGDEWLRARGFPAPHDETLSALFRLMGAIRSRWKPAQMRYIRDVRGRLQREVAELHAVDESTVSKALQAARFRDVEAGESAARTLLRSAGGTT